MVMTTVCDLHTGGGIPYPVQFVTLYKLLVISKTYFQNRVSDMVNRTPLGIMGLQYYARRAGAALIFSSSFSCVSLYRLCIVPFHSRTLGSFLQYWSLCFLSISKLIRRARSVIAFSSARDCNSTRHPYLTL
jgi:hypothetical protein